MSYRSWCFTLNNYSAADEAAISLWMDVKRLTVGREIAPDTETPHLQGAVTFDKPKRLTACKGLLGRAHWEKMRADDAAFEYCRKGGDILIDVDTRKKSNDKLRSFYEDIKDGVNNRLLLEEHPGYMCRYPAFPERARMILRDGKRQQQDPPPTVIWLWGPTGTGKTASVVEREDDLDWVSFQKGSTFVIGYTGQPAVLIDDFRPEDTQFALLLRLLDVYRPTINVKGGSDQWAPRRVYITSPDPPEAGWTHGESIIQLTRRLTHVIHSDDLPGALQVIPIQGLPGNTEQVAAPEPVDPPASVDPWDAMMLDLQILD